ncbi:ArnT family glycosyltransferase [Halocola ammonii]
MKSALSDKVSKKRYSIGRWTISLLFAFKVLIFAAAFPLFNTTDELPNFDTLVKQGKMPWGDRIEKFTYDSLTLMIAHEVQSSEYLLGKKQNPDFVPLLSVQYNTPRAVYIDFFSKVEHQQVHSSPLYFKTYGTIFYQLPDSWSPYSKVYFLRFLNAVLAFFLTWFVISAGRKIFRDEFLAFSAGLILLATPQSIFYFINVDILSALSGVLVFYSAFRFFRAASWKNAAVLALVSALTILIKASGLVAVAGAFFFLLLVWFHKRSTGFLLKLAVSSAGGILLMVPVLINRLNEGIGLFATKKKVELLDWTEKPLGEWFPHPIFSFNGFRNFFTQNWGSWWTGESFWEGGMIYPEWVSRYFKYLSAVLLLALFINFLLKIRERSPLQQMRWSAIFTIVGYFTLFAFLSVRYDFGDCVYPSQAFPLFVSGRLMLGMLFPVLFAFVDGERLIAKGSRTVFVIAAAFAIFHLGIEIYGTSAVFSSPKNFFHQVLNF